MKKTLILHIGMGKTGTTALQKFFWSNRERLEKLGISYPKYGIVANAHHLLSPHAPKKLKSEWEFKSIAEWGPRLQREPLDRILLSSELIAWASRDDIVEFCQSAGEWFDLNVVIYLRRQDNIIMANYNQLVKVGSQRRELDLVLEGEITQFDYKKIIEPWENCLGKGRMIVRPYEEQQLYRGDICRDFMHHVFDADVSSRYTMPVGDSNPRFSTLALEYKLLLNQLFKDAGQAKQFNDALSAYSREASESGGKLFSNQPLLSPSVRNDIIERARSTNEMIAREFLGREDGLLFYDALPDETGAWQQPVLTAATAGDITQYVINSNGQFAQLLAEQVRQGLTSIDSSRRRAAKILQRGLPPVKIGVVRQPRLASRLLCRPLGDQCQNGDAPLMLISVHFPAVHVNGYVAQLTENFGDRFVRDYEDQPINSGNFARNFRALKHCIQYGGLSDDAGGAICVHGHFMPLKYRLLQTSLRKRHVTWMRNPVERLIAHHMLWKDSSNRGGTGTLRRRMFEENWSLEKFCFSPELRNIYSKFLWGFPLRNFDFIGIAEFHDSEIERFSREVLNNDPDKLASSPVQCDPAPQFTIDQKLRQKIERYHSADMTLYRRALQMRDSKLKELSH